MSDDEANRKLEIELIIRSVVSQYGMYWHKLLVESAILILAVCFGLASFSVSQSSPSMPSYLMLSGLILALGAFGMLLHRQIVKETSVQREILVKLDEAHQLFTTGVYLPDTSLYPAEWRTNLSITKSDPIEKLTFLALAFLPPLLALSSALKHYLGWS